MSELGFNLNATPLYSDNQGLIFIASNPVTEKRSKHINIRYHYIHEVVDKGFVKIYFVDGDKNPTDLFTKNLGRLKFEHFRVQLSLEIYSD